MRRLKRWFPGGLAAMASLAMALAAQAQDMPLIAVYPMDLRLAPP